MTRTHTCWAEAHGRFLGIFNLRKVKIVITMTYIGTLAVILIWYAVCKCATSKPLFDPSPETETDGHMSVAQSNYPMSYSTEEVEELALLVPSWQIMALADAAESEGLTVAQFVRRLLSKALVPSTKGSQALHSA